MGGLVSMITVVFLRNLEMSCYEILGVHFRRSNKLRIVQKFHWLYMNVT